MNSNQLHQFLVIAEELNMTKAAERLYMSQSALSSTIKNLETELDTQLFERRKNRLYITEHGTKLLSYARSSDNLLEEIKVAFQPEDGPKTIRIAAASGNYLDLFALFYADFKDDFKFTCRISNNEDLFTSLKTHKFDIIISPSPADCSNSNNLVKRKLIHEQLYLCAPSSNPLNFKDNISIKDLNELDILKITDDSINSWSEEVLKKYNVKFNVVCEIGSHFAEEMSVFDLNYHCIGSDYYHKIRGLSMESSPLHYIKITEPEADRDLYLWYNRYASSKIVDFCNRTVKLVDSIE